MCGNYCLKSVHIRSYSGPHFPAFGLNTERYGVSLRIQFECGEIQTRITPNTDTFYAVNWKLNGRNYNINAALKKLILQKPESGFGPLQHLR